MIREEINKFIITKTGQKLESSTGKFGDFCLTPGTLNEIAKDKNSTPAEVAQKIADDLKSNFQDKIEKVEYEAGYLNIYLSRSAYLEELEEINKEIDVYLADPQNADKMIVFDYSSPNIAKPFSVGHLRSTIIGQANLNIHKVLGYKTVGINHLGDWGTQFGKLIVAYKKWGNDEFIKIDPINHLNDLYVQFHVEAEKDETLNDEARAWFKRLEDKDPEAREIWQKFVDLSFIEFNRIYGLLGVKIDETVGESFYIDKQKEVIAELKEKNLLKESEGAQIVELTIPSSDGTSLPPVLIQKKDGATLYMTRDLAAIKYRIEKYNPEEIIYHVGNDQSLHFQQLTAVVKKLGWDIKITHASHGMIRLPEGKMSTRKGRVVRLDDLISEAQVKSREIIKQKNPDISDQFKTSLKIAISAIKYADLAPNRKTDIVFSFDKMVTFSGNSGPYLQYTYARCRALIRKFEEAFPQAKPTRYIDENADNLAKKMLKIKNQIEISAKTSSPNLLCEYAFELANEFNNFYEKKKIVTGDAQESSKAIYIVYLTEKVLGKVFDLLGIEKLERI